MARPYFLLIVSPSPAQSGRRVGLLTLFGLLFPWNLRLWQATVETLVLVILATCATLLIGIPLGIPFALSRRAWRMFSPVLDRMHR